MKQSILPKAIPQTFLIIAGTIALTLLGLSAAARYDNKYIAKAPLTQDGFSVIPENGYCSLVDGWELYPDVLLFPEDFASDAPSGYRTWAGEYPNLSLFHEDRNPYGVATWRLFLQGNGTVTLYLQEPLCDVSVYINGQFLGGTENLSPENYSPLLRDTSYCFAVNDEAELIIQTVNYSHYYGGIWYAPVIGDADSISHFIAFRMLFYSLLFFPSLTLALFCIVLWIRRKKDQASFYFGMLSLSFAVRICYPFLRLFHLSPVRALYAAEDAAALLGIYFSLRIAILVFGPTGGKNLKTLLRAFTLGMCGAVVVIPLLILPSIPALTVLYGPFISWYKVIMAGVLISLSVYGCFMTFPDTKIVLAAATANGVCLLYGVLSIGYYEPFIGAYPEEYGAFCMVIAFAVLMVRRSLAMADENQRLRQHLQDEVNDKTEHLQKLLTERGQLIAELGHDMKSPLTSLSNMAQIIRMNDIMLDQDTRKRMLHIEEQCGILSERLKLIQEIAAQTSSPIRLEPVELNTFLLDFYHNCRPIIELYGPNFLENITSKSCCVMANRDQLFRALENLLYNAADFTPTDGQITLSLTTDESSAYIGISDTGCGISKEDLPNIFNRSYTTRPEKGGQGLGLAITRAIILEHGGQIEASSSEGTGTLFTIRLPLA